MNYGTMSDNDEKPILQQQQQQSHATHDESQQQHVACVFGSTGAIGQNIVKELLDSPQITEVHAFVRKPALKFQNHAKYKEVILSPSLVDDLEQHFPNNTNVVFSGLGTTIKQQGGDKDKFFAIDYTINHKVAEYARAHNVPQFYLVSSAGADSTSSNFYLNTKGKLDDALIALQFPRAVIYRPGILKRSGMRPDEPTRVGEWILDHFVSPLWCCTSGWLGTFAPIQVQDVAKAMVGDYLENKNNFDAANPTHVIFNGSSTIMRAAENYSLVELEEQQKLASL